MSTDLVTWEAWSHTPTAPQKELLGYSSLFLSPFINSLCSFSVVKLGISVNKGISLCCQLAELSPMGHSLMTLGSRDRT